MNKKEPEYSGVMRVGDKVMILDREAEIFGFPRRPENNVFVYVRFNNDDVEMININKLKFV
jgi:hypothetical protein